MGAAQTNDGCDDRLSFFLSPQLRLSAYLAAANRTTDMFNYPRKSEPQRGRIIEKEEEEEEDFREERRAAR